MRSISKSHPLAHPLTQWITKFLSWGFRGIGILLYATTHLKGLLSSFSPPCSLVSGSGPQTIITNNSFINSVIHSLVIDVHAIFLAWVRPIIPAPPLISKLFSWVPPSPTPSIPVFMGLLHLLKSETTLKKYVAQSFYIHGSIFRINSSYCAGLTSLRAMDEE